MWIVVAVVVAAASIVVVGSGVGAVEVRWCISVVQNIVVVIVGCTAAVVVVAVVVTVVICDVTEGLQWFCEVSCS